MKKLAVFGNPIAHSLSPYIHQQFARQTDIELSYQPFLVANHQFLPTLKQFVAQGGDGLNITLPYKVAAYEACATLSQRAQQAGSVNTIRIDSEQQWYGDNTDGEGLITDVVEHCYQPLKDKVILIFGAGGAVRGILAPLLAQQPTKIIIVNRTLAHAQALAEQFGDRVVAYGLERLPSTAVDVVFNAIAASTQGQRFQWPDLLLADDVMAYDLQYGNSAQAFLSWGRQRGIARLYDGYGMLLEQAALSFWLWFGVRPSTLLLRRQRLN